MKKTEYGITFCETLDEFVDPKEYGINIAEICDEIRAMKLPGGSTPDDLKPEILTRDLVDKYQTFARERLGFEFDDISLFITALTHRSYVNEHRAMHVEHNERLEFLGDAILEQVVSEFLYRYFDEPEGLMTAWRSSLVRTESIAEASREIGYTDLIRLSRGARNNPGRAHENIIADCFEAVTGAIFLDQGYAAAKRHIYKYILVRMPEALRGEGWRDPKSHLQEITQKTEGVIPQYHLLKVEGPDHAKTFTIELTIAGKVYGRGVGNSKQAAQALAAEQAIQKYCKQQENTVDDGKLSARGL